LWVVATIEIIFYSVNVAIIGKTFKALDIGGAMTIHTFGGYFGLAASFFF
jgi:hypothetical protein